MAGDQRHKRRGLSQSQAAAVLLLPFLAVYGAFLIYPFFMGVWISLHDWNLLAVAFNPGAKEFIGVENYVRTLWGRNIEWGLFASPVMQTVGVLGIGLAFLGYRQGRLTRATALAIGIAGALFFLLPGFQPGEDGRWYDRRFWPTVGNTILFVGLAVPGVTITADTRRRAGWRDARQGGPAHDLLPQPGPVGDRRYADLADHVLAPAGPDRQRDRGLGGSPIVWLTDQQFAMAAIVITTIWWSLGIAMILFLAGLQDISKDIYEAAASTTRRGVKAFWYITLPNLKRTITLVVVLQIILHFQVFGQSHLMTQGGPNDSTQVLVRYIYQTAFRDSELGKASAMAVFLFVIMGAFSLVQFVVGREEN
jgi:multiple sugar transport system permease protein